MKLSEKLLAVAEWLENNENHLIVDAEDEALSLVANAVVKAAEALRDGAADVSKVEPELTEEKLDEIAAVAAAFDESGDELLMKQASVLDEILMTIAAPRNAFIDFRQAEDDRLAELKKKYKDTKELQDKLNKISDALEDIKKAPVYKSYRPLEAPLSTRTCIDHPGEPLMRIGEHHWKCMLDGKTYNHETGYKLLDGSTVPGGDVSEQTKLQHPEYSLFDTRAQRLGLDTDNK